MRHLFLRNVLSISAVCIFLATGTNEARGEVQGDQLRVNLQFEVPVFEQSSISPIYHHIEM